MSEGFLADPGANKEEKMELSCDNDLEDNLLGHSDDDLPPHQELKKENPSKGKEPAKRPSKQNSPENSKKCHHSQSAEDKISHSEQAIKSLKRQRKERARNPCNIGRGARIRANADFKMNIKRIQKNAEQEC